MKRHKYSVKKVQHKENDSINHSLDNSLVMAQKTKPIDKKYLKALDEIMSEWKSEYDENAFSSLQDPS